MLENGNNICQYQLKLCMLLIRTLWRRLLSWSCRTMCFEMTDERNRSAARFGHFYYRWIVSGIIWTHLRRRRNKQSTCPDCYKLLSSPKTSGPALESIQASIHRVPGLIFREGTAGRSWIWRLTLLSSVEVKNGLNCTSTTLYAFMAYTRATLPILTPWSRVTLQT